MHFQNIVSTFLPLIASLSCAASLPHFKSELVPKARISRDVDHTLESLPHQTIGHYFDGLVSEEQNTLGERDVHRTQEFTEVTWTDGSTNFNISMSRCVTLSDKAGLYTAKIGNLPNATVQDIVNDLHVREGSDAANRIEYSSRVKENAELAIAAANDLLGVAIADYTPITTTDLSNTHGELRHLLTLAEMVVLIIRSSLSTEILISFFAGVLGRVTGGSDNTGAALCAITLYSFQVAIGILDIVDQRPVDFVAATIYNIFLAWVRDSMRVFAGEFLPMGTPAFLPSVSYDRLTNQTVKGTFPDGSTWPLAKDLVEMAMKALGYSDQPRARYKASPPFNPGKTCPARGRL